MVIYVQFVAIRHGIVFDMVIAMLFTNDRGSADAVTRRLVVVLWLGEPPAVDTLAGLQGQGIGVIHAKDAAHGAQLLMHFRPDAVVGAGTDTVRLFSDPSIPLILVGTSGETGSLPTHVLRAADSTLHTLATTIKHVVPARTERPNTAA